MPSVSKKQHNLMAAVANSPAFAKKVGIKQSVGQEFMTADKGKKFKEGGMMKHDDLAEDKKLIKKAFSMHDKQLHEKKKTDLTKLKGGGMARMTSKGEHSVQKQSKRGAEMVKMAKGGLASGHKSADGCAIKGKTRGMMPSMCGGGMAKGKK
jgi:hypothetical protein